MVPKIHSGELNSENPSSYSGIWKYPTNRDVHFQSVLDWITNKRKDDDLNGLWRVNNKIYNLETFVKHHPGGSDWLEISRGTDITEAFQVSHVINPIAAEKTLERYFVRDTTTPRYSPYTFEEDGFYKILKKRIQPIMKEVGTGPTDEIKRMMDSIVFGFFCLSILGTFLNSTWLQILAGLFLAMVAIGAHNFAHLKHNWRTYCLDLTWASSFEFRISHVFSHHCFPNTILDAELSLFEPILEFLPKANKNWIQRHGPIVYNHVLYSILFGMAFLTRWMRVIERKQLLRPEFLLVWFHLALCLVIAPDMTSGLTSWVTTQLTCSYFYHLCAINSAHHAPSIFHDGDEARKDPDFGLCQLDAVRERSDSLIQNSLFVQLVVLGEHSLHHLFPTICNSKLKYIRAVFEETLEEFGENFPAMSSWDHFKGCLEQLRRSSPKSIEERKAEEAKFSSKSK